MKSDFGWDFLVTRAGDCTLTADGDFAQVRGPALVAQDVATAAKTGAGSLFYAPEFGQGLVDLLRGPGGNSAEVVRKLRDAALGDERVDWDTVEAGQYAEGKYFLRFRVLGEIGEQVLRFDIAELLDG